QLALGTTLVKRRDHGAARQVLISLTGAASEPLRAQAHVQLAHDYFRTKNFTGSLRHLEAAQIADADSAKAASFQYFLGQVHDCSKDAAKARDAFAQAVETEPLNQTYLAALIQVQLSDEQNEENRTKALDLVRRFTHLAGNDPEELVQAADFHLQLQRLDD